MKIGARVQKTGLVVVLSIMLARLALPTASGSLAGIAAVMALKPTVRETVETFWQRIVANAVGGIMAIIMCKLFGTSPIAIGLATIMLIAVLNAINLEDVISLAVVTVVVIMCSDRPDYVMAAIIRVLETVIGVAVSLVINAWVLPPRYEDRLYNTLDGVTKDTLVYLRAALRKNTNHASLNEDLKNVRSRMDSAINYWKIVKNDIQIPSIADLTWRRKERNQRPRKLVVYRQMVKATQQAVNLLTTFHNYEYAFHNFDDNLRIIIRERLETLMSAHEQINMKFVGKVPPSEVNFFKQDEEQKLDYLELFFNEIRSDIQEYGTSEENNEKDVSLTNIIKITKQATSDGSNEVIHFMSAITHYEEALEKTNKVVRQYRLGLSNKKRS